MPIHYPNGRRFHETNTKKRSPAPKKISYSNRGMTLEEDLNETNRYYLEHGLAVIHKKPTPVQIVSVDYPKRSAAVIKEAYFKQASTTDFNGVYQGKYIDFEAKETKNKTSFPLSNFHDHQVVHMQKVIEQNGISFVILRFTQTEEIYLLDSRFLISYYQNMDTTRKSIRKSDIEKNGHLIKMGFHPRVDYLKIVDSVYFSN
ncbi:Holliday junction resolvase RecU [Bacillus suaedae]|uniref:Holliday junction resolvase RecU n=1 Tax=Halalkalibacter suaedae TaxID=2822140 RepID=A0A941AN93_9BACI|nr:Holliday junction resolvase RecU [Bacillus suaedae]MBP3950636.1 Holliday junction resolvase RecU [Bacillus suaedae]